MAWCSDRPEAVRMHGVGGEERDCAPVMTARSLLNGMGPTRRGLRRLRDERMIGPSSDPSCPVWDQPVVVFRRL